MFLLTTFETGINIIEWPPLQYCTMSAFGEDALQRSAMLHKSSFIIIDYLHLRMEFYNLYLIIVLALAGIVFSRVVCTTKTYP